MGQKNLVCMLTHSPDDVLALNLEITEVRNRQKKNIPKGTWEGNPREEILLEETVESVKYFFKFE